MWQKITRCRPVARCSQVYIEGGLVSSGGIKCLKCGYFFGIGHHFQSSARALIATLCCTLHFMLHTQYITGFSFDPRHDLQVRPWTIPHHTPTHTPLLVREEEMMEYTKAPFGSGQQVRSHVGVASHSVQLHCLGLGTT